MKKNAWLWVYSGIAVIVFFLDRVTKQWAFTNAQDGIPVNRFLSFDLVLNRGVTNGLLYTESVFWFNVLSCIITAIIILLSLYTYHRWSHNNLIIGEVLTMVGAVSNVADRYWVGGVIDFIHITLWHYSFPIFNVADICIVLGVGIIFLTHMKNGLCTV